MDSGSFLLPTLGPCPWTWSWPYYPSQMICNPRKGTSLTSATSLLSFFAGRLSSSFRHLTIFPLPISRPFSIWTESWNYRPIGNSDGLFFEAHDLAHWVRYSRALVWLGSLGCILLWSSQASHLQSPPPLTPSPSTLPAAHRRSFCGWGGKVSLIKEDFQCLHTIRVPLSLCLANAW